MKKFFTKKLFTKLILGAAVCLGITSVSSVKASDANLASENAANLIIFVDFEDTVHENSNCFTVNPRVNEYWVGNESTPRAMKQYLYNVSYGDIVLDQIMPQYDSDTNTITAFKLSGKTTDIINNEYELVSRSLDALEKSGKITSGQKLDYNNDGYIDNLTIVVPGEYKDSSNKTVSISARSYCTFLSGYTVSLGGKNYKIGYYNYISEASAYIGYSDSGVLIHEYLHTQGFPDLYYGVGAEGINPVYTWDIMSSVSLRVQYPLAYFRSQKGANWISIPEYTLGSSGKSTYTITAPSVAQKSDTQAVILKTDYSDTEFFVVEYRIKGTGYTGYETGLPGTGVIVYRINTNKEKINNIETPWGVYVFRPNDKIVNGVEEAKGDVGSSFIKVDESYGTTDFSASLEDNAITYSDGHNSGIVIKNVSTTADGKATIEVTYEKPEENKIWTTVGSLNDTSVDEVSCMLNGKIYILKSDFSNKSILYTQENTGLVKVTDGPTGNIHGICSYNGKIYISYVDGSSYKGKIARLDNNSLTTVYTTTNMADEIVINASESKMYIAFTEYTDTGMDVLALNYNGTGFTTPTIISRDSSYYSANISITECNGVAYFIFREAFNGNIIVTVKYNNNKYTTISNNQTSAYAMISSDGTRVYELLEDNNNVKLYQLTDDSWTLSKSINTGGSAGGVMDICYNAGKKYITVNISNSDTAVLKTYEYDGATVVELGNTLSTQNSQAANLFYNNGYLYEVYIEGNSHRLIVKNIKLSTENQPEIKPGSTTISSISNTSNGITVKWNAITNAEGYKIYRKIKSANDSTWTLIANTTSTNYEDTTVLSGTTYSYKIQSYAGTVTGDFSQINSITRIRNTTISKISNVDKGISLAWYKTIGATKYKVYRKTETDAWKVIATITDNSYIDQSVTAGKEYEYKILPCTELYSGVESASKKYGRVASTTITKAKNVSNGINLTWTKTTGATKYMVYRKRVTATWETGWTWLKDVYGTTYTDTDKNLNNGYTYVYVIIPYFGKSYKGIISPNYKITYVITTTVTVIKNNSGIGVSWAKIPGATKYQVFRKTIGNGWETGWTWLKDTSSISYTDTKAEKGKTYVYAVKVFIGTSQSGCAYSIKITR